MGSEGIVVFMAGLLGLALGVLSALVLAFALNRILGGKSLSPWPVWLFALVVASGFGGGLLAPLFLQWR